MRFTLWVLLFGGFNLETDTVLIDLALVLMFLMAHAMFEAKRFTCSWWYRYYASFLG